MFTVRHGWRTTFKASSSVLSILSVLGLGAVAHAQATPETRGAPGSEAVQTGGQGDPSAAGDTAASSTAPVTTPPVVSVQTGAPQPPSQNLASPLPPAAQSPSKAVVRVGGGMILLYSNNYAPARDPAGNDKKHIFDVWRASIVLDAKLDRWGMHIEFRARDRGLRWMPVNSWLEELYASVDLIKPGSAYGPLVLKIGKEFSQFGRFWDNSFYGNLHLRDGLKLVPDWGLSFEGTLGAGKTWGGKYYAQYFIVDGQTSTANTNRDTISIVAPGTANQVIGARKREQFVLKLEPSWTKSPTMTVKVGASFQYFQADFPDTVSMGGNPRIRDRENIEKVMRYGADLAAQLAWFGIWAEYVKQDGRHTNAWPYGPVAANPAAMPPVMARAGASSDDVTYYLAGANFTYDRWTIQYNYNSAIYKNIPNPTTTRDDRVEHREWIHNPSLQAKVNDQIRLILEFPMWKRNPAPGLQVQDPTVSPALTTGNEEKEVVEQQVLLTLHGKF